MIKKEVDIDDTEAILKGKDRYRVVWEEEEEILPDNIDKNKTILWSKQENQINNNQLNGKKSVSHPINNNQHSIEFVIGTLTFIILIFLFFVNSFLFWVTLGVIIILFFIFYQFKKIKRAYVDKMQQNIVYLKIKNPILTGFEFALGIGLFGLLCIIFVLVIFGLIAFFAAQGIWTLISPYIPI